MLLNKWVSVDFALEILQFVIKICFINLVAHLLVENACNNQFNPLELFLGVTLFGLKGWPEFDQFSEIEYFALLFDNFVLEKLHFLVQVFIGLFGVGEWRRSLALQSGFEEVDLCLPVGHETVEVFVHVTFTVVISLVLQRGDAGGLVQKRHIVEIRTWRSITAQFRFESFSVFLRSFSRCC